ncbi:MAG: HlyC/CorC family transporter [Planctomycetes bacterium]|nr:HlyC/CorC family transporter [Planctomycetota bacterium]
MIQDYLWQIITLGGLLCLSAFFSGSETALFSLSKADLSAIRKSPGRANHALLKLARHPSEFLHTVLLCNMLVNILFYSLAAGISLEIGRRYAPGWAAVFSLSALMLVIILGEVTPKSLAVLAPRAVLWPAAIPMLWLHLLLAPVRRIMKRITGFVSHFTRHESTPESNLEELKLILQASASSGELNPVESALVGEIIDLSVVKIKEFMTPRVDLVMIEEKSSIRKLLTLFRETKRAKIPVFRKHRDDIIGVVDAREVFLEREEGTIRPYIHPPIFITEYQRANNTLRYLQAQPIDLAIVTDEYGGTAGIITLSDILAEVFGEPPGTDQVEPMIQSLEPGTFILAGNLSLRDWKSLLQFPGNLPAVDTVSGLVTSVLGYLPKTGDSIRLGRIRMTVRDTIRHRVKSILLEIIPPEDNAKNQDRGGTA